MPGPMRGLIALTGMLALAAAALMAAGAGPMLVLAGVAVLGIALSLAIAASGRRAERAARPRPGRADPRAARLAAALLDGLPEPVLVLHRDGRIALFNAAARARFPRLAEGAHIADAIRAPALLEALERPISGQDRRSFGFQMLQEGRELAAQAHLCPLPPGIGAPLEGAVLLQIADRSRDREIERMRADFVANASHELRTPLAAITGYIETLQGPAKDDPQARERFLAVMAAQAQRMKRLIDDLMSLNQIELAERSPPDTTCPLHDVVREAVAALAPLARQRGVDLDLQLDAPNPVIRGDRGQLVQVFVNLIDNALKYGGGSGPVEIATAAPDPGFPGMTGIAVADHGPGIAREHVPRLTERFYRVSVSESRNVGGTGLGLAIVKHVLGRHRGDLQIESTPGEGSRFTVWLPVPSEAAPHPDADDTAPQAGGNSGTVA